MSSHTGRKDAELLPCPFCGGEANLMYGYPMGKPVSYIGCVDCGAARHTAEDWNRRFIAVPLEGWQSIEIAPKDGTVILAYRGASCST